MQVRFVVHESYEGPGALAAWVNDRGHAALFSFLDRLTADYATTTLRSSSHEAALIGRRQGG